MNRKVKLCLIGLGITVLYTVLSLLLFLAYWWMTETGAISPAWNTIVRGMLIALAMPWGFFLKSNIGLFMCANGITWSMILIGLMELIRKKKQAKANFNANDKVV